MRLPSTSLRGALLALCLTVAQSCSHRAEEFPVPASLELSVSEVQTWYHTTHPETIPAPSQLASRVTSPTAGPVGIALVWVRAITCGVGAQRFVLVPLASDAALFAHSSYLGVRYLIVAKEAANALNGNVVELLVRRTPTPVDTVALVSRLYQSYRNGHMAAPPAAMASCWCIRPTTGT